MSEQRPFQCQSRRRTNSIPDSFAFATILSKSDVTSSVLLEGERVTFKVMAVASFVTCYGAKCSAFKITRLIYVHCVSKEEFSVCLKGFSCAALCCREIHWSYLQSMQERRVSLVPKYIEEQSVEELFDGLSSPVLTRINCSCDITVSICFMY